MNSDTNKIPPKYAERLLIWLIRDDLSEEILGDLEEKFYQVAKEKTLLKAKLNYWFQTLNYLRPFAIKKTRSNNIIYYDMYKSYFKIGYRNLLRNKGYSLINIGGLAVGIAVALLIGLWIQDELDYDKYHSNYGRITQVMQKQTFNKETITQEPIPYPLEGELIEKYGDNFEFTAMTSWQGDHIMSVGDKKITRSGNYMGKSMPHILTIDMKFGTLDALTDLKSILISSTTSESLFGNENPIGKFIKIDNDQSLTVTGVYEDLPYNTTFNDLHFIANFEYYTSTQNWIKSAKEEKQWGNNSFQLFATLAANADLPSVNEKIINVKYDQLDEEEKKFEAKIFLHPMSQWHLRSNWENGVQSGGMIQYVWLFGIVGVFVLILACINFMNLSTAQSEKRAKEVGIRKSVGSTKNQLIQQFLTESFLVVLVGFFLALLIVFFALPYFNHFADKHISMQFNQPFFWVMSLAFILITGFLAGSYPALYLSSFNPVSVLKGTFRVGTAGATFRKVLVVVQFTVSVALIIGTMVVYNQIQFTKDRPLGYDTAGIITIQTNSTDFIGKFEVLQTELKRNNAISSISESSSPLTGVWSVNGGFEWDGMDPNLHAEFGTIQVTHDFGKTVSWDIINGRDFSKDFATDSSGFIFNESAIKFMSIESPIGKTINWSHKDYKIVGVVKDLLMESPFKAVRPTVYMLGSNFNWIEIKLNPDLSSQESIAKVKEVFAEVLPNVPFEYKFVSQHHADKFALEERIGNLSSIFSVLAIFISCVGLFGLAAFTAEQRTKEIGIRKVLGATTLNLWQMLSSDFLILVIVSIIIATPLSFMFLSSWLEDYEYHTELKWWIFAFVGLGAMILTLLTVSFQAVKAARMNPVSSLRSE